MSDVTQILNAIEQGDQAASEKLLPLVYAELQKMASRRMAGENPGQTLQATALVHEAYVRLVGSNQTLKWDSRGHFFAAAAEAMRRILIDNARRKKAKKHGGGLVRVLFPEDMIPTESDDQLLALDEALARLNALDPIKAELVRLRFFSGLKMSEVAVFLGISSATADRYWAYARAWLHQEVQRIAAESD